MKIAIHNRKGSFSDRWITYCKNNNITYKVVNAFDNDIISQVKGYNILFWHHSHAILKDTIAAKRILFALEHAGIKVFPDFRTGWHFDNKIAQKYLLEAIDAPMVQSYVFYDKKEALNWAKTTSYPKVWKLKGGAGSANVKLVESLTIAKRLINKGFNKGFPQFDRINNFKERIRQYKAGKSSFFGITKGLARLVLPTNFSRMHSRDKGYVYFQDFIPNNTYDIRVIVISDKAFAIKRKVRKGDFRASGSGNIVYDKSAIDEQCIKISFKVNDKIKAQAIAFDYVFINDTTPKIIEISYGFAVGAYDPCPGYWDINLNWYPGEFNPQEWIIETMLKNGKFSPFTNRS